MLADSTKTQLATALDTRRADYPAPAASATLAAERDPWAAARCRDGEAGMLGLFFSDELDDIAQAKVICSDCPLAGPCLDGAVARHEPAGVWGGQLFADGRILAFKRKRGRPPKAAQTQLTA